jgi:aminoglycoside phosphotransferase (APT) family kinase protein
VDGGWDHQLWRLGDDLAVRLPRTERAPDLVRKEYRWLPVLAPRLPLPVPVPLQIGEPCARFPKPWTIVAWVHGSPCDAVGIRRVDHAADALAAFLRALHQDAPADAPANLNWGDAVLGDLTGGFEARFQAMDTDENARVREVWADAVAAPGWEGPPTWVHTDLHPANVVVDDGTIAGVVDFGDLCAGDPAIDLAAAWLLLPPDAAARFLAAYGSADEPMVRRARGWAVLKALGLIDIGRAWERGLPGGKRTWGPAGRRAVESLAAP